MSPGMSLWSSWRVTGMPLVESLVRGPGESLVRFLVGHLVESLVSPW